ncbi:MAG: urate hydroxylase PuuD [Betaproteobacteria bacterium]
MDPYYLEWANLLLRWIHVITAIAWVGSSFYFVFLDSNLVKPNSPDLLEKGVDGALWAVHGGGFYNPQKYMVAPKKIHTKLHWFFWESYTTWLSGFALFTLLYLFNASAYLIDKSLMDWTPPQAVLVALSFLLVFWVIYDRVSQWVGFRENGELGVGLIMFIVIAFASWLACHWFAGRAAFLLVGAMMATSMSANVFFWIIPGQRKVVGAMTTGQKLPAAELAMHGKRGKQRSVHNTYFTLPVLFAMLSTHYSFLYAYAYPWVTLVAMMLAGALIRQFFVQRHAYHQNKASNPLPFALIGVVVIVGVIIALKPESTPITQKFADTSPVGYLQVQKIFEQRCYACHGAAVQMKNLRLDSPQEVKINAQNIYQQSVVLRQMPMNNSTQITDQERELIKRWFDAGAPTTP